MLVMGAQMFLLGGVTAFFIASRMYGNTLCFAVDPDRIMGVDHLYLDAHISIGNAVIMFVLPEIDMVVLGHFMASVVLDLKSVRGQLSQCLFFIGQKLLLPAMVLLLHTGLVVCLYSFLNGPVQGG